MEWIQVGRFGFALDSPIGALRPIDQVGVPCADRPALGDRSWPPPLSPDDCGANRIGRATATPEGQNALRRSWENHGRLDSQFHKGLLLPAVQALFTSQGGSRDLEQQRQLAGHRTDDEVGCRELSVGALDNILELIAGRVDQPQVDQIRPNRQLCGRVQ